MPAKRYGDSAMKIASIVLFVLLIASIVSLVLTANALKSTKAQLAKCFDFHRDSVTNHVEALIDRGVIDNVKNLTLYQSSHGLPMTLYDLKVFNMTRAGIPRALARGRNASNQIISQKHLTFPKTRL